MRASLLASAIASMLRWSRFDACSTQGHKPRIAARGRRTRTTCAACTNNVLRYLLPRLEILPRIVRSPVDSCFGTSPSQVAIGWVLGGPGNDTRRVLALGTAQRNIAAALVVGSQSFSDPKVVVMVIVVAIVGLIILMPLSRALANR